MAATMLMFKPPTVNPVIELTFFTLAACLWFLALFRFGVLTLTIASLFDYLLRGMPLTLDPSAWYLAAPLLSVALMLGLIAYGFHTSVAGQPLFRDEIFTAPASHR